VYDRGNSWVGTWGERKEGQVSTRGMDVAKCERERKKRGEIQNEDGRKIRWMKEIWKRRERIEEGMGDRNLKNVIFGNWYFYVYIQL
jgi:hypothetical protein